MPSQDDLIAEMQAAIADLKARVLHLEEILEGVPDEDEDSEEAGDL